MSTEKEHIDQLREAIERMHRGSAQLTQSLPVRETFEGKPVWAGVVHVFDLTGHPDRDSSLRLVLDDRGEHQAAVVCRATYSADQFALRGGAGSDRRGA
jgi:hypothetical protein